MATNDFACLTFYVFIKLFLEWIFYFLIASSKNFQLLIRVPPDPSLQKHPSIFSTVTWKIFKIGKHMNDLCCSKAIG